MPSPFSDSGFGNSLVVNNVGQVSWKGKYGDNYLAPILPRIQPSNLGLQPQPQAQQQPQQQHQQQQQQQQQHPEQQHREEQLERGHQENLDILRRYNDKMERENQPSTSTPSSPPSKLPPESSQVVSSSSSYSQLNLSSVQSQQLSQPNEPGAYNANSSYGVTGLTPLSLPQVLPSSSQLSSSSSSRLPIEFFTYLPESNFSLLQGLLLSQSSYPTHNTNYNSITSLRQLSLQEQAQQQQQREREEIEQREQDQRQALAQLQQQQQRELELEREQLQQQRQRIKKLEKDIHEIEDQLVETIFISELKKEEAVNPIPFDSDVRMATPDNLMELRPIKNVLELTSWEDPDFVLGEIDDYTKKLENGQPIIDETTIYYGDYGAKRRPLFLSQLPQPPLPPETPPQTQLPPLPQPQLPQPPQPPLPKILWTRNNRNELPQPPPQERILRSSDNDFESSLSQQGDPSGEPVTRLSGPSANSIKSILRKGTYDLSS